MTETPVSPKSRYRALCEVEDSISVFARPWWLDAVAGPNAWDVVLAETNGQITGALPFVTQKRKGVTTLTQPKLTPALGPWLRPQTAKATKALAMEGSILADLCDALGPHDVYRQNWHPDRGYWLPFFWKGFEQTTRYTYRLTDISDHDKLWSEFAGSLRREIRKAENRFGLVVRPAKDASEFTELNAKTFARQGRVPPYSDALIRAVFESGRAHDAVDVLVAEDPDGVLHAGALIARSATVAYYLAGGADPDLRTSGAASLCLWSAIRQQPDTITTFDFEGSMIEPIERFFRGFGAVPTPYFSVTKAHTIKGAIYSALLRRKQRKTLV